MKNCKLAYVPRMSLKRIGGCRLLLFIFFLSLVCATPAQAEEGVLDKKITLIVEQKEIRDVLNDITRLVEIKFVYSAQKIPSVDKRWIKPERLNSLGHAARGNARGVCQIPSPLHRVALESFLIAGWRMIRP